MIRQIYPYTNLSPIPTDVHTDLRNFSFTTDGGRAMWSNHGSPWDICIVDNTPGVGGPIPIISNRTLPTTYGNVAWLGYGHDNQLYGLTDTGNAVKLGTDGSSVTLLAAAPGGAHVDGGAYVLRSPTRTFICCFPAIGYADWNFYDVVAGAWRTLDTTTLTTPAYYGGLGAYIQQWCVDSDGDLWGFGTRPNPHNGDVADTIATIKFSGSSGAVLGHWATPASPSVTIGVNGSATIGSAFHRKGASTDQFVIGWNGNRTLAISRADPTNVLLGYTQDPGFELTIRNLAPNPASYWTGGEQVVGSPKEWDSDTLTLIRTIDPTLWTAGVPDLGGGGMKYDWRNNAWVTMDQGAPSYITWRFLDRTAQSRVSVWSAIGKPQL